MNELKKLIEKIRSANSLVLSTHRESDGDGLGSQIALYYALLSTGKKVRILNVDAIPSRYVFLDPERKIQFFEEAHAPLEETDLALIFDTNDERFLQPLFSEFKKKCREILFVDHHPELKSGPLPTAGSYIDTKAASTGEIVYQIIREFGIQLNPMIARALYASISFDTQIFRYIRNSPASHLIVAELLKHEKNPEEVHRKIFGNQTIEKMTFLSKALGRIEYFWNGRVAILKIHENELSSHGLTIDASRDLIDMIMNIETLEMAVLFREDSKNNYKVSFRSKGRFEILSVAENLGGGGHTFAAGAYSTHNYEQIKSQTLQRIQNILQIAS